MKSHLLASLIAGLGFCAASSASAVEPAEKPAQPPTKITFKKIQLDDKFRSEGVAIGHFSPGPTPPKIEGGVGRHVTAKWKSMDIAAGTVYYAAPDWKRMVPFADKAMEYDPHGYSNSFCNFAEDLNGDGADDIIVVDFPGKQTWWWENPGAAGGIWKKHVLTDVTNNESPSMWPLFGEKQRSLICAFSPDPKNPDGPDRRMAYLSRDTDPAKPWTIHAISAKAAPATTKYSHGVGVGDVNGDGRPDILCKDGWWEAPADPAQEEWTFHKANFGPDCSQMYVYDVNGDGRADVISASAHAVGIWWHEQLADGTWKTHEIDKSFSQTHGVCFADITGTGVPSIITGKRWWAHGPTGDVDPGQPAVLCWFELVRKDGQVEWVKHLIDEDSGVGTQFEVGDINGDGLLDIAISNKKGVFVFLQERAKE